MALNKNCLFYQRFNCVSAISAPKILSFEDEFTFLFSNFLIIDLYNFSAKCWFPETTSELIPVHLCVTSDFLSKQNYKSLKQDNVYIHDNLDF